MAKNVSNNDTLEVLRTSYNDLVDEVGGLGTLRTSQKGSLVDSINSIIDQYFYFQDFEYDGSDGSASNKTFSGADNLGNTLQYSTGRLLVFKNGLLLRNGTDYSATNGTSITLTSSAANSDIIRITSFTGSYEGVAGASVESTTQWTKTGGGSIYNHDTTGGVVINSNQSGVVAQPLSGYGIQLESDGSNIYLNTGSTNKKVFINGDLDLASGAEIQINGSKITSSAISGFDASARGLLSAGTGISYNSSTGQISATGSADTTGNAGTATALETARTIHGVSFNGTANIDLTEQIQDTVGALISGSGSTTVTYNDSAGTLVVSSTGKTQEEIEDIVGAMVSSNTETGITVTYDDNGSGVGSLDFVIGNDAIVNSMIADDAVNTAQIADDAITNALIADDAVNTAQIADDAITSALIADNAVALETHTTGDYVGGITGGTGITASGATSGEGIAHTLSITNTGVTAGTYGSASAIPALTINAQGQVTAATTNSVDTYAGWETGVSASDFATVSENDNVYIQAGEGIDVTYNHSDPDHTFSISGENASTTNKGIASFNATDFSVSNGAVSIVHEHIEDIVGAMFNGNGSGATTVTYNDSNGTVSVSSTDNNTTYGVASSSTAGLVKIGFAESGKNYPVELSSDKMYVNVPWTDTNTTYSNSSWTITALSGYNNSTANFLRGDGTWATPPDNNTTYSNATTSASGLMSSSDKSKLNGIASGATNFSGNTYSNAMNQHVRTSDTVTFGEVRSTGNVTAYYSSDIALKENLNPIDNALNKVMSLSGYNFDWKDSHIEERGGIDNLFMRKSDVGIVAQEVQKVLPEAVGKREDGTLGVRYELLVPLLVESIKELKEEIQSLKS
tara:strand:- start:673 stop:3243 length:2571 start_codon:yes stop_codon:yes gene_type:complete